MDDLRLIGGSIAEGGHGLAAQALAGAVSKACGHADGRF
jgi:hypothetical protein